jgi:hypothetical protein
MKCSKTSSSLVHSAAIANGKQCVMKLANMLQGELYTAERVTFIWQAGAVEHLKCILRAPLNRGFSLDPDRTGYCLGYFPDLSWRSPAFPMTGTGVDPDKHDYRLEIFSGFAIGSSPWILSDCLLDVHRVLDFPPDKYFRVPCCSGLRHFYQHWARIVPGLAILSQKSDH